MSKRICIIAVLFLKYSFAMIIIFFYIIFVVGEINFSVYTCHNKLDYWAYGYCNIILQLFYSTVYKTCAFWENIYSIDILRIFVSISAEHGGLSQIMMRSFFFFSHFYHFYLLNPIHLSLLRFC